jgi:hypothetical protein
MTTKKQNQAAIKKAMFGSSYVGAQVSNDSHPKTFRNVWK